MARAARVIGLFVMAAAAGIMPSPSAAQPSATITVNRTEFKAGDTLTVGLQVTNPLDGPPANLYVGVVMPGAETALFFVPGGLTPPVSLGDPANFRSLRPAAPGFSLNDP